MDGSSWCYLEPHFCVLDAWLPSEALRIGPSDLRMEAYRSIPAWIDRDMLFGTGPRQLQNTSMLCWRGELDA